MDGARSFEYAGMDKLAKSPPFQGGDPGSNPGRVTSIEIKNLKNNQNYDIIIIIVQYTIRNVISDYFYGQIDWSLFREL